MLWCKRGLRQTDTARMKQSASIDGSRIYIFTQSLRHFKEVEMGIILYYDVTSIVCGMRLGGSTDRK